MKSKFRQVGWFVVGDGKHGLKRLGDVFQSIPDMNEYWKNRGYELVPAFVTEEDFIEQRTIV